MNDTKHITIMFYASAGMLALSCSIIAAGGDKLLGGSLMLMGAFMLLLTAMPGDGEEA
jgi:hypothetical protein